MEVIKDKEVMKALFNDIALNDLIENINKLPDRMNRGLKLVYPERRVSFLDELLDKTRNGYGVLIENAIIVMQALEDDATIEEADKLIEDHGNFSKQIIRGYVLTWSKRGPEFFRETLPFPISKLDQDVIDEVNRIDQENLTFAKNEKAAKENTYHI